MQQLGYKLALFLALGLVVLPACQKKCQAPGERLQTFVGTEFRLVESTDRAVNKDLTNTRFNILSLQINYSGAIFDVVNNDKFENPKFNLRYNVDPARKLIRWQLYEPAAADGQQGQQQQGQNALGNPVGEPQTFRYKLSNEFELTNLRDGSYFRFVPFQGVVKPDEQCEF